MIHLLEQIVGKPWGIIQFLSQFKPRILKMIEILCFFLISPILGTNP